MSKITVFTVVYNNYGHFIPQWIEWMKKQTIKPEILIVLGKDHGADIEWLEENNIKYVFYNSDNMGKLRNAGLKQVRTDWWLYFSVDDELLPHACEEIINTDADAVSLTFDAIEPNGIITKKCYSPCINSIEELNNWQRCWGGYVAVKENYDLKFNEDIEVPNLTLHFELFRRGLKTVRSKDVFVIHHRWNESHHYRSTVTGKTKVFVQEINNIKEKILNEIIERGEKMIIEVLKVYIDNELKRKTVVGERYEVSKERYKVINNKLPSYIKLIDIVKKEEKTEKDNNC